MNGIIEPFIAAGLAEVGVAGGITVAGQFVSYSTIIASALLAAASVGLSYLAAAMASRGKSSEQQQTIKQALPPRTDTIGMDMVGGAYFFHEKVNGDIYIGVMHGDGPFDAIEANWLDDKEGPADASAGIMIEPWMDRVSIESHLGATDQAASSMLRGAFPTTWTEDHRLRGVCYSVIELQGVKKEKLGSVYPSGFPKHRVRVRGARLYDPRTDEAAWSDTAALGVRYFLTHPRGMGLPASLIDDASFAAAADLHEENVAKASGGTERRYPVSLTYTRVDTPHEVLGKLLRSCDGELYPTTDGRIGLRGGVWEEPTVSITDADVISYDYQSGSGVMVAFNRLKATFKDPSNDWQPNEVDPWEDAASQADVGVLTQDADFSMVTQWRQARRLAKIESAKKNARHIVNVVVRYRAALAAWGERCVYLTVAELGLENEPMWIGGTSLDLAAMTGALTLRSLDASAYEWNPATDEGAPPVVAQNMTTVLDPPSVTGLSVTLTRTEITSGVFAVVAKAAVTPPTVAGVWTTIGRYKLSSASGWTDMSEVDDWSVATAPLSDGQSYDIEVAHGTGLGADGPVGAWSSASITAVADPNAPGAPVSSTATKSGSDAVIAWAAPNSANVAFVDVLRGSSSSAGAASVVASYATAANQAGTHTIASEPTGTHWYFVRARNASGAASATVSTTPASLTF